MKINKVANTPMLNAYPDSMGGNLSDIIEILEKPEFTEIFSSFYILPSLFNTDLDRGFSVISYDLNEQLATIEDLEVLNKLGIDLKLDFILNHASVLSEQFQDIIKKGNESKYKDFFINWNSFWNGYGEMTEEGYIQPNEEILKKMFFRKKGLPILMVRFPKGENIPYWNTFYQEVKYPELDAQDIMQLLNMQYYSANQIAIFINTQIRKGKKPSEIYLGDYEKYRDIIIEYLESHRKYLGQMDLNIKSPLVWEFYDNVLRRLASYGAKIVRLDAFAYAPKEPGEKNFLNDPGTWDLLDKVRKLADKYNLTLLPEIHANYDEKTYEIIATKGYMAYDFFLPVLYLQHGHGENETTWVNQGKVNFIFDNLISQGKANEAIIVMCNGMLTFEKKNEIFLNITEAFEKMLTTEVIPYIEQKYRTYGDKKHRAMAGLSMGSMQTSVVTLKHQELFDYVGIFSGFVRDILTGYEQHIQPEYLKTYSKNIKYIFRAIGEEDIFMDAFLNDDKLLKEYEVEHQRNLYKGYHEWKVWQHCIHDFLCQIFKD